MDFYHKLRFWSYHRQYLGQRGFDLLSVLRDIVAVYSSHPTAALSLQARVSNFKEQKYFMLEKQRLALRIPAMRGSVYLFPRKTAPLAMSATLPPPSDPYWQKRYSQKGRFIPEEKYGSWKEEIITVAEKPLTVAEIKESVNIPEEILKPVLNRMAFEGKLLRIGAENLKSNILKYVPTEQWLADGFKRTSPDKSLIWLAGEYLRAYGPARVKDFQWWSGVTAGKAKTTFSAFETVTLQDGYVLLKSDFPDFEKFNVSLMDSIDLLPQWDCYTMGYAPDGRDRFVTPDMQDRLYGKLGATGGNALGAVLVNGLTHGVWTSRFKGYQMMVTLNLFEKPVPSIEKELSLQFEHLAGLLKAKGIKILIKTY